MLCVMAIVVPLTTITTVNAEDWTDRLGRVLFGRHNDFLDFHEGKITQEEFNQREKVRETTWKATALGVRSLMDLPYMGSPTGAADKILEESGLYDDSNSQKHEDSLGGINFSSIKLNYIATVSNSNYTYTSFLLKTRGAKEGDSIIDPENAIELSLNSFFIGLTIPNDKFWVNLNPWEPDRIIEEDLDATDVGKIMLEADLQMKKDFCKYKDPCTSKIGETYWGLLDEKREELIKKCMQKHLGQIKDIKNVQFQVATRHWIVPNSVDVYEGGNEVYIANSTLDIYSEPAYEHSTYEIVNQDAFFVSKACKDDFSEATKEYGRYAKELEEETILPLVVHVVNHGKNYSDLRCVYNSLALAQWYKEHTEYTTGIFSELVDSGNLTGFGSLDTWSSKEIWERYVKSYEEGEYHCWKNTTSESGRYAITESKFYQGGGVDFETIELSKISDLDLKTEKSALEDISASLDQNEDFIFFDFFLPYSSLEKTTIQISKLMISPAKVKVGKPVTIKVVVKNAGEMEDTKTINIEIDDEITGSKEVTLAPDEIITLEFTQIQSAEGDHSVTVDGLTGNYEVVTPGFEVIFAIIGLLSVVYLINLKKRKRRK